MVFHKLLEIQNGLPRYVCRDCFCSGFHSRFQIIMIGRILNLSGGIDTMKDTLIEALLGAVVALVFILVFMYEFNLFVE
jgi:hypothetical protein